MKNVVIMKMLLLLKTHISHKMILKKERFKKYLFNDNNIAVKYSHLNGACEFNELLHRRCSFCNFKSIS